MPKFRIGWICCCLLFSLLIAFGDRNYARAESSWTETFEVYPDGGLLYTPWAAVGAYADGVFLAPYKGIMAAHLGDSKGGYLDLTSYRLSRSVNVKYTGTTLSFWASFVMNDTSDVFVFESSADGGFTWTQLMLPTSSVALTPWTQYGPYTLPVGTNFIRFRFDSNATGNIAAPGPGGVWIDEIAFKNPGYPIVVSSLFGDPQPPDGFNMVPETANVVNCSVTSPYDDPLYRGVRYICTGWTGDGVIVPATGTLPSVTVVVNGEGAYITWNWKTQYGVDTVSQNGVGVPNTEQWFWFDTGTLARVTGIKYVESQLAGYGWRCSGFIRASDPDNITGTFLAEDNIELTFVINKPWTVTWLWNDQFKVDVINPGNWGSPIPATGANWFDTFITFTATIDSVVSEGETIRHMLLGYELYYGNNPNPTQTGTGRVINDIILAEPVRIVWNWRTDYLLDVRNPQFIGVITPDVATYWVQENQAYNLTAHTPASDGVNNWLPIGYIKNGVTTYLTNFDSPTVTISMTSPIIFTWIWEMQTLPFQIISKYGAPTPAVGLHAYPFDATVTASVYSPYLPPGQPGIMHVCTGYTATGSVTPAVSSQLSVSFKLRAQNTTVTWNWYTQYKLIVLSTIPDIVSVPEIRPGGFWYAEGARIDASVEARIPGYRCSGYLLTEGEAQATGSNPFLSFNISAPSTITWQWEEEQTFTTLPKWNEPLQISDINNSLGVYVSMKRDPVSGRPSAVYYKIDGSFAGSLYYTYWDGARWHTEFVDGNTGSLTSANVGLYAKMALDSFSRPHVVYYDAKNGDLKYAFRNVTGGWQVTLVDSGGPGGNDVGTYCSLALNALNEPRISYYDATAKHLKYAALSFGVWSAEIVDSSGQVGSHTSISLDPQTGLARVAYRDSFNRSLKFASFDGNNWSKLVVDASDDTGYSPSMVIDTLGNAHIVYQLYNGVASAVIYAIQSGNVFYTKTVASSTTPDTGFVPSLALTTTGNPFIAFNDIKTHSLIFTLYNGQQWLTSTLDSAAVGSYISLDLFNNVPGIAYWSFTGLRYIEAKSGSNTGGTTLPKDTTTEDGKTGGGGCFIATSAFGSISSASVESLIAVRDSELASVQSGNNLVALYYAVSPSVASSLNSPLKAVVRDLVSTVER